MAAQCEDQEYCLHDHIKRIQNPQLLSKKFQIILLVQIDKLLMIMNTDSKSYQNKEKCHSKYPIIQIFVINCLRFFSWHHPHTI